MRTVAEFVTEWYSDASGALRRADPLLMGAAFAYNALFALVPLTVAFVSLLTLLDLTNEILADVIVIMEESLPVGVSSFLIEIINESVSAVEKNRLLIVVLSVPIALWSGSRAVYAVQKALRLMQDSHEEVRYARMRITAILVTLVAGVGVVVAYFAVVTGERITEAISSEFGRASQVLVELGTLAVGIAWIVGLFYSVYRWGAPRPIPSAGLVAMVGAVLLILGSRLAIVLMPTSAPASLAVFGTIGVILVWLYAVGVLIVAVPIAIGSLQRVLGVEPRM